MQPARTTKGAASSGKLRINAPNPIYSNYTKRRIFAVLVSENTGETLFGTYKKSHLGASVYLIGQTKGAKGPERLNAERTDKPRQAKTTGGGKFSTPGVVERRGGGELPST